MRLIIPPEMDFSIGNPDFKESMVPGNVTLECQELLYRMLRAIPGSRCTKGPNPVFCCPCPFCKKPEGLHPDSFEISLSVNGEVTGMGCTKCYPRKYSIAKFKQWINHSYFGYANIMDRVARFHIDLYHQESINRRDEMWALKNKLQAEYDDSMAELEELTREVNSRPPVMATTADIDNLVASGIKDGVSAIIGSVNAKHAAEWTAHEAKLKDELQARTTEMRDAYHTMYDEEFRKLQAQVKMHHSSWVKVFKEDRVLKQELADAQSELAELRKTLAWKGTMRVDADANSTT